MPITLTDDHGNEIDIEKADGGTLRRKLEEALSQNKSLTEQIATSKAAEVVREHGAGLVKAEDLVGVPVDQMEAKAKELAESKTAERAELIRTVLEERGLEGDDLDQAVSDFLGGDKVTPVENDGGNWPDVEGIGGARPKRTPALPDMTDAMGNLQSAFENTKK